LSVELTARYYNQPRMLHSQSCVKIRSCNCLRNVVLPLHRLRICLFFCIKKKKNTKTLNTNLQNNTGFSNLEILLKNQIASLKNYFLNRARDNTFFNALVSADKGYTPLNLSDNIISDIVKSNIPDTIANIKQKSLHGRYFKELE
jgi:hypothetical protein